VSGNIARKTQTLRVVEEAYKQYQAAFSAAVLLAGGISHAGIERNSGT